MPTDLVWSLIDDAWNSEISLEDVEATQARLNAMPAHVRHLYAATWIDCEVGNGGFWQLFSNSAGVLAPEAVDGFTALGMPQTAAIVAEAINLLGSPFPRDRNVRDQRLSDLEDTCFDGLEDQFYTMIETEAGGSEEAFRTYAGRFAK
ncbi:DUF4375 domain-containing protein [Brevundimonas sp.]|uniref:DMP19 family protein n=1 Tax=Brevundimonas sp. TaxID=1871086 RepID=UPI0027309812|nr:DUF4375 domain-containing protein [Brevundimonas sp.]MDP1913452.1 DUF4375 domain-containing protein [Brevundimonas sp.]